MLPKIIQKRAVEAALEAQLPYFLSGKPGQIDIIRAESNNILFNLATEEYMFDHLPLKNPVLFLWRNSPTIIIGKHQNPWKECMVQLLEENGVILARRKSGGGAVYQDLGNSVFSFINPVDSLETVDFKTMNNDILLGALKSNFGLDAKASGRNDLIIEHDGVEKKISGSAYKLRLGNAKTGEGRRTLHHGTMLLDLELGALGKYLNPNKTKLESKGIDSVISRVINLKEINPYIEHDTFCKSVEEAFIKKWDTGAGINSHVLSEKELMKIPKLMEIFKASESWDWRFGNTPKFQNIIEKKFEWALVDIQFNVEKGFIVNGQCYSDCLVPHYIEAISDIINSGEITYDVPGMQLLCTNLKARFEDNEANEMNQTLNTKYTPDLEEWLCSSI